MGRPHGTNGGAGTCLAVEAPPPASRPREQQQGGAPGWHIAGAAAAPPTPTHRLLFPEADAASASMAPDTLGQPGTPRTASVRCWLRCMEAATTSNKQQPGGATPRRCWSMDGSSASSASSNGSSSSNASSPHTGCGTCGGGSLRSAGFLEASEPAAWRAPPAQQPASQSFQWRRSSAAGAAASPAASEQLPAPAFVLLGVLGGRHE